jgi:hypothetical protein
MERRNPELSELLIVEMAPAPGVKLIRVPAPTRASQSEICTNPAYARGTHRPDEWLPERLHQREVMEFLIGRDNHHGFHNGLRSDQPVERIPMFPIEVPGRKRMDTPNGQLLVTQLGDVPGITQKQPVQTGEFT